MGAVSFHGRSVFAFRVIADYKVQFYRDSPVTDTLSNRLCQLLPGKTGVGIISAPFFARAGVVFSKFPHLLFRQAGCFTSLVRRFILTVRTRNKIVIFRGAE